MTDARPFTVVVVVDVPPGAVGAFQRYEDLVLPLLVRHDGVLERRLRNAGGTMEIHVLSFPSEAAYRGYLGDPERLAQRALLADVTVSQRVLEALVDVDPVCRR